jgi:hypothetical protein
LKNTNACKSQYKYAKIYKKLEMSEDFPSIEEQEKFNREYAETQRKFRLKLVEDERERLLYEQGSSGMSYRLFNHGGGFSGGRTSTPQRGMTSLPGGRMTPGAGQS